MPALSPSVQEEAAGALTLENLWERAQAALSEPDAAILVGLGAFILIFLLVLFLMAFFRRTRNKHAGPARKEFFEPAGENAEITFEDENAESPAPETKRLNPFRLKKRPVEEIVDIDDEAGSENAPQEMQSQADKQKPGPFANLFSPKEETARYETRDDATGDFVDGALFDEPEQDRETDAHSLDASPRDDFRYGEDDEEEQRRIAEAEARRRHEQDMREQEAERRRRLLEEEERAEEERRLRLERRKAETALDDQKRALEEQERILAARSDTLRADVERLHERLGESLEERFAAFSRELQSHLDRLAERSVHAAHDDDQPIVTEAYFAEFAELLSEQISSWRDAVNASIDRLSRRIDQLNTAPENSAALAKQIENLNRLLGVRRAGGAAAQIQLSDILKDSLPPNRYVLAQKLSTGRTASACITMPGRQPPIAVDARFPLEAFQDYERKRLDPTQEIKAENDFRRVVLRHIADIAEKLISPGETASGAMAFIPSEHILSALHENFSDLVQESYRAKVWLVSPTSLMATLNTISAVMSDAEKNKSGASDAAGDNAFVEEMAALKERLHALEANAHRREDERANPRASLSQASTQQARASKTSGYQAGATKFGGLLRGSSEAKGNDDPDDKDPLFFVKL